MEAFGMYLLKSAVWLTGFTVVFLVFLRNERYFQLNRAFLLSGIFASIVFPFYTWHYAVILPSLPVAEISIPEFSDQAIVATVATPEPGIPFYWYFYILGIAFLAFRLIWQTALVIRKLSKTVYVKNGPVKLVRTPEFTASFSFFSFVFVNPSTSDIELEEIVNHECGHIQKRHWFDLLLVELLRILQWFNPFVWIYAHLVRQNHEYLADEMALKCTSNPAVYQATLLNQMLGVPVISLANSFSYSLNKKRFKMMKKKIDSPFRKLKMLFVLPLITLVFYAFEKPEYKYSSNENHSNSVIVQKELYYIEKDSVNVLFTSQFKKSDLLIVKSKLEEVGIEIEYTSMQFSKDENLKQLSASYKNSKGSAGSFVSGDLGPTEGPRLILKSHPYEFGVDLSSEVKSLKNADLARFLILVETTNEGIKLTSMGGCAWKELSFNNPGTKPQAIDEYGMTVNKTKEESASSRFLFTISKTENGLSFQGIKGTAWERLTFSCPKGNCHQAIDQYGMTRETVNTNLQQNEGKVNGKVTAEDGKPLQGATIIIKGTTTGTTSDAEGNFKLTDVPEDAKLVFSHVGLKTAEMKPVFDQPMIVKMDISIVGVEKIIVNAESIADSQHQSSYEGIKIRVIEDKNPPLIMLDGKVISRSEMDKVDRNRIANISILKDSSATHLYGDQGKNGVILISTKSNDGLHHASTNVGKHLNDVVVVGYGKMQNSEADAQKEKKPVFQVVEQMPQFPGGEKRMMYFLSVNTKYPVQAKADKVEGTVVVNFVVSSTGKIENVKVVKSVHPALDEEAVRVVSSMPDWDPGKQNGKAVDVSYVIPIEFSLKKPEGGNVTGDTDLNRKKVQPFAVVEQMPQFPGGATEMMKFIKTNLKYPVTAQEQGIEGIVVVGFVVNSKGRIELAKIARGVNTLLDAEAIRIVNLMPNWIPGKQSGKDVAVSYTVPFKFNLN